MKGFIVGLAPGTREYTVNGVKYVVGAKFRHRQSKDNFADRIKRFITSDFAHLSVDAKDDIIEAEYTAKHRKMQERRTSAVEEKQRTGRYYSALLQTFKR